MRRLGILTAAAAFVIAFSAAGALKADRTVTGKQVSERTEKVMESIDWQGSLDDLKEKALKEKRLIFWLQLVGELEGGL